MFEAKSIVLQLHGCVSRVEEGAIRRILSRIAILLLMRVRLLLVQHELSGLQHNDPTNLGKVADADSSSLLIRCSPYSTLTASSDAS
jgi:hypothetical protein